MPNYRCLLLSVVLVAARGLAEEPPTVSVCDVLRDPVAFNGKIIAVRGILTGTDEGVWLKGESCADVMKGSEYPWKSLIALVYPGSHFVLHKNVEIRADRAALDRMAEQIRTESKDREHDTVWVTYVGLLETWANIKTAIFPVGNGRLQPGGFGHLSIAPAQLVIKTVRDIVIEPAKQAPVTEAKRPRP